MNKANIIVNVRKPGNGASLIDISGDVNAFAETALMDAYTQACNGNTHAIILNFSGVEYMNSSGIGLLVTLLIRVNRHAPRQKLLVYGLSEHYRQIFDLTRLNEAIGIYADEAEALGAVRV